MAIGSGDPLSNRIDLINKELEGDVSSDSLSCSIFKVPNHLRKVNEKAYEPQVVAIGPYHRGKDHLKAMEVHKKHYLKLLLARREENSVEKYMMALAGVKEEALKFYSEPLDDIGGEGQFEEMMLFDGCFIVELIRKSAIKELRKKNDHLLTHFILRTVMRDLLLIENQLPFVILTKLFDMTKSSNEADQNFMHMAINCFSIMMPGPCIGKIKNHPSIKHLLGLLHDGWVLSPDCEDSLEEERPSPHESLDEEGNPLSFSTEVSTPEQPEGERFRPHEATAKSGSSSPSKPSWIVKRLSSDAVAKNLSCLESESLAVCMSQWEAKSEAPFLSFSPSKSSEEEKSLPSNTVLMTPQHSEIEAKPVNFLVSKGQMSGRSFLSSDDDYRHFSAATDAPLASFQPSKASEGAKSLPSDAIFMNIHHSEMEEQSCVRPLCLAASRVAYSPPKMSEEEISQRPMVAKEKICKWQTIRSASELHEAGIRFKHIEGRLFDINFEDGVMSIPTLKIVDDTESILRNLVAYEQCYKDISSRRFTEYIRFMDCLINTGKDVELLCHREVIENRLGDNEVVADIFNRICDSVLIVEEDFFYAETFIKVNDHCKKRRNRWMANLRHNYFNTPWAFISFLAAVFLLLLTVMQSIYASLAYHLQ